ncbi:MAG: WxL domain-containing protein [Bacillota bacterium]
MDFFKNTVATGFALSLIFGGLGFSASANTAATDGSVGFQPSNEKPPIVNPTDPEDEIDPEDFEGTEGPLSLDYAPSLNFGTDNPISVREITLYADLTTVTSNANGSVEVPNFVQVTDNRGSGEGWSLLVKQEGQFKTGDEDELIGAEITFENGELYNASGSISASPIGTEEFTLEFSEDGSGQSQVVMEAAEDTGEGSWGTKYAGDDDGKESVSLTVPGTSTKVANKTYSTTLVWTLQDAPQ